MCADPSSLCSGCLWSSPWRPSSLHVGHAAESILVHHHSSGHSRSTLTSTVDIHSSATYNPHYVQKWSGPTDASVLITSCIRCWLCWASGQEQRGTHQVWPPEYGNDAFILPLMIKTKITLKNNSRLSDWIWCHIKYFSSWTTEQIWFKEIVRGSMSSGPPSHLQPNNWPSVTV